MCINYNLKKIKWSYTEHNTIGDMAGVLQDQVDLYFPTKLMDHVVHSYQLKTKLNSKHQHHINT